MGMYIPKSFRQVLALILCLALLLPMVPVPASATELTDETGSVVSTVEPTEAPTETPTEASAETIEPTDAPAPTEETETGSAVPECDCGNAGNSDLVKGHSDGCARKRYFTAICDLTAEEIYAQWSSIPADGQEFILTYLSWNNQTKLDELNNLLSGSGGDTEEPDNTGSSSATAEDGTTVSVTGIPEGGKITVAEVADETAKAAIETAVAAREDTSKPLFMWDISLQNAEGVETQPDGTVRVEMQIPGVTLHKYAEVFVLHVDDSGVAAYVDAEVTENGGIAFTTDGFSTFAGFTVDFEYNGEAFSINGLETILLSGVFDALKMPLYVSDVANVEFTNYELVTVEKQDDGDWLLTSLQAFLTTETLTVTMNDGTAYEIVVTDDITTQANFYIAYMEGGVISESGTTYYIDGNAVSGGNAEVQLFLDSDGHPSSNDSYVSHSYFVNQPLVIDGRGVGGSMEIILQKKSGAGNDLVWDLTQLRIINGAKVVIRLGASFTGTETITIRSNKPYTSYAARPLFDIEDGSLYFNLSSDEASLCTGTGMQVSSTSSAKQIVFDGGDLAASVSAPLIYTHRGVDETDRQNLVVRGVTFRNAKHRAVLVQTNNMNNLRFANCTFESTVRDVEYGGGAIYIDGSTDGSTSNVVDVANFTLTNCTFDGNSGASGNGGAIASYGDIHTLYINGCTFKNCTSAKRGGAIELSANAKTKDNHIFNWFKIENTTFTNCTAGTHGGAIDISYGDDPLKLASNLTFSGCTFTNCTANNRGGAIRMVVGPTENSDGTTTARNLTIDDCDFSGCTAGSHGGGISLQGKIGNITVNNGSCFQNCSAQARGGAIGANCASYGDITLSSSSFTGNTAGSLGGAVHFGLADAVNSSGELVKDPITAGDVNVTGCTFGDNTANGGIGGGLALTDGNYASVTIQTSTFTDCFSANYGGAIAMKVYKEEHVDKIPFSVDGDVKILNCTFTSCGSGGLDPEPYDSDGDGVKEDTWDHDGDSTTAEITRLNGTGGGGAICIGGVIGGEITIAGESADANSKFTDCYTWNNGGAICLLGSVKTPKTTFQYLDINGCRARDAGGAIHLSSLIIDDLNMSYCTIQDCSYFTKDFEIDIPGTAYDSLGTDAYVAYDASGTFRVIGNTTCRAVIDNCEFKNNESYSNGGGVYWNANNIRTGAGGTTIIPSLQLKNTMFDGNYAVRDGGGLYCEATIDVDNCTFQNNSVGGRGGGIAQQVYNNEARTLGEGEATNLILDSETRIHDNTATHGGGISITVSETVSVADGTNLIYPVKFALGGAHVYNNKATRNGGGIYYATKQYDDADKQREVDNFQKEILIDNGDIYNNVAGYGADTNTDAVGGHGGGIYMESNQVNTGDGTGFSKLNISSGSIYKNTATKGNGGGIYLTGKNALCTITGGTIGGSTENANKATKVDAVGGCGGGIAIAGGAHIDMTVVEGATTGGVVSYNDAAFQGGGIWLADKSGDVANTISIEAGQIVYNKVSASVATSANGGGVFVGEYGSATLDGGEISNNTAPGWGGGIFCNTGASVTVNDGIISSNTAQCGAGVAFQNSGTGEIKGGEISHNIADSDGGGIYALYSSHVTVSGGNIQSNTATNGDGGGIFALKSTVSVGNGDIQKNTAKLYGGGIYAETNSMITVSGGNILSNTATNGNGGGLHVHDSSTVTITNGIVKDNTAGSLGGGIHAYQNSTVNISGGDIQANSAESGGGIAAETASAVTVNAGEILKNTATENGGGIYADNAIVTVSGGTISENTAGLAGGGISLRNGSTALVTNDSDTDSVGTITKNTAARGGGVSVESGAELTVENGFITYNKAVGMPDLDTALELNTTLKGTGGGIYVADGNSDADPAKFTLTGEQIAIYGNLADFAADDVFANGNHTVLNVPQKAEMNLAGYEFSPEGWFEDYPVNDINYESGLALAASDSGITNGNVYRYRGSTPTNRVLINDNVVDTLVNVANKYVCMTLGIPAAVPDTVVIDYGLPVDIKVLLNEQMTIANAELVRIGDVRAEVEGIDFSKDLELTETTVELGFGTATITNTGADNPQDGAIRYTPSSMGISGTEEFSYAVKYTDSVNQDKYFFYYANVTIIPATTIYYEDEFVDYTVWDASSFKLITDEDKQWVSTTGAVTDTQDQDRPGEDLPDVDADNIYGYDGAYTGMATYSMGSAKKVTVNEDLFAEAQFTFCGTGFDIISLTSNMTGTILVDIYKTSEFKTDAGDNYNATPVESFMVDTYYGYKYALCNVTYIYTDDNNGGLFWELNVDSIATDATEEEPAVMKENPVRGDTVTGVEYVWIVDSEAGDTLYQVPVIKVSGLEYGQYTALISVSYKSALDHKNQDGEYDFYLDAIRIYDPANDGATSETVKNAYMADGEGWPEYFELRNLIISKNDFDALTTGNQTEGVVFIDNTLDADNNVTYSIEDYTNYGPNNEVYLAPGQSVAFNLDVTEENLAKIHLAMKSVEGAANVTVCDAADSTHTSVTPIEIATATDLYYDITSLNHKTVVITNTGTSGDAILSITNVKVTYTSEHTDSIENSYFTTSQSGAEAAVASVMMLMAPEDSEEEVPETTEPEATEPEETEPETTVPEDTEPETTVPEVTEPGVFTPDKFELRVSDSTPAKGSRVVVTVTTSADVDHITVNGKTVTKYTTSWFGGSRVWSTWFTAEEAGEMDVSVICYNADDLASETVTKTITVSEKSLLEKIWDLIGGWLKP